MDATSLSLPISSKEGSASPSSAAAVAVEDEGALSVTHGLAEEAELLFKAGKHCDSLRVLTQLLQKKGSDPKIVHNVAIVEYFQDGFSDPKRLIELLHSVKKRSEELAHASGEHTETASSNGNKTSTTKGSSNLALPLSDSPVVCGDEFDTSVTMFNTAVIWFYLHEYEKAFSILDSLYQNIEPIDEGTALRICLLLLDVSLLSHHASRAADVIAYMERVFYLNGLINQVDNANSAQQQPTIASKSASLSTNPTIIDSPSAETVATSSNLENSLSRTLSDEGLEDESLQLLSSLDISGQNLHRPPSLSSSNDLPRTQAGDSLSANDLRLKLHLYKVRFLVLARNLKAAKREVKMAMNIARGRDYSMALFLKSQLEYARGNHRKAIKLLMASSNRAETGISSMYYNNLGCIYYRLGKYSASGVFFSKALSNSILLRKEKRQNRATLAQDYTRLLIYNVGMMHLACGRPLPAANCFQKASLVFNSRPILWVRIAECCLMALEKGLIKCRAATDERSDVRVHVIGKGKWRELVVEDGISRHSQGVFVGREDLGLADGKQLNLSVSLARQCLLNALYLLDRRESKCSQYDLSSSSESTSYKSSAGSDFKASGQVNVNGELKEQKTGNNPLQNSVFEYGAVCLKENHMMKQATLANLAYVELELENASKALSAAKSLLELPECSRIYTFLGNIYAAEALCMLNRPKEAAEYLMTYVSEMNIGLPYTQEDCEKLREEKLVDGEESNVGSFVSSASSLDEHRVFLKPEEARGIILANYAASAALQGDLEKARELVMEALSVIPNSTEAIFTAIYVDLMVGKTQEALAKLKQCSHIRFLPGSLALDGSS